MINGSSHADDLVVIGHTDSMSSASGSGNHDIAIPGVPENLIYTPSEGAIYAQLWYANHVLVSAESDTNGKVVFKDYDHTSIELKRSGRAQINVTNGEEGLKNPSVTFAAEDVKAFSTEKTAEGYHVFGENMKKLIVSAGEDGVSEPMVYVTQTGEALVVTQAEKMAVYEDLDKDGEYETPVQGTAYVEKEVHEHKFGAWKVTKQPTALEKGIRTAVCSCGEKKTASIEKLKPTCSLNFTGTLPMKTKQTFKGVKAAGLAAGDSVVRVISGNKKLLKASYKKGTITLKAKKKTGKVKVTIVLKSGLKKSFTVKIQKKAVQAKKVVVSAKPAKLNKGKSFILEAKVTPITAPKLQFKSSNKKVVSVSGKGVLKAKKKGKATITVSSGKKKVKFRIAVK